MSASLITLILFATSFASGISVLFVKRDNTRTLKLILSFSGAYLFSITVLHLMPHVYHTHDTAGEPIGLYVLAGFLFQLLLEQFSQGIEHGHIHHLHGAKAAYPFGIMISLCVHALLEGMPLASHHQHELLFGIALHHIPAAFALGSLLVNASASRPVVISSLAVFAAMTPVGYLLSKSIHSSGIGNLEIYSDRIMAVVIGIFLHISTTILFESGPADHHRLNRGKLLAVAMGIALSLVNFLLDGHAH